MGVKNVTNQRMNQRTNKAFLGVVVVVLVLLVLLLLLLLLVIVILLLLQKIPKI